MFGIKWALREKHQTFPCVSEDSGISQVSPQRREAIPFRGIMAVLGNHAEPHAMKLYHDLAKCTR